MEPRKLIIKIAIVLIGLSVLVLLVLSIVQYLQIQKLTEDVTTEKVMETKSTGVETVFSGEAVQRDDTQRISVEGIEKEISKDEIDELTYQLEAAEEELDMVQKSADEQSD